MTIGVIDSSPSTCSYLKANHSSYSAFDSIVVSAKDSISEIADRTIAKKFDAVFVNIECQYEASKRSDLKGIELIFWLRLKHNYTGPIITFGFLSAAQVLRFKPQHVVLHAPGNMHWRLGDELKIDEIPTLITKEQVANKYKSYLVPIAAESKLRHENANKWAIWKLSNLIRKLIDGNFDKRQLNLESLQSTTEFLIETELYKTESEDCGDINGRIKEAHSTLEKVNKRVLLIDDMAEAGWGKLFSKLLNCQEEEFETLPIAKDDTPSIIAESALKKLNECENGKSQKSINLILLDLRLKNEKGDLSINEVSGVKVLKKLKNERPDIPIIIVTASNKLQTNKVLDELGVWGIWTKEGQDNRVSNLGLRQSLLSLLVMVNEVYESFVCAADYAQYEVDYRLRSEEIDYKRLVKNNLDNVEMLIDSAAVSQKTKLGKIHTCIVDSNIFMVPSRRCGSCDECLSTPKKNCSNKLYDWKAYVEYQLLLRVLSQYFSNEEKELSIHNHTFSEVRKKTRRNIKKNEVNLYAVCKRSLEVIEDLEEQKLLKITELDNKVYDMQAYADPLLIDNILSRITGQRARGEQGNYRSQNILLITDDSGLRKKVKRICSSESSDKFVIAKTGKQVFDYFFEKE